MTVTPCSSDAAGNETADAVGTYTWNAEGELKLAGGVTYTYDGDGRRVEKSNGKLYWYGGGNVIEESDASGNMQESYVFFGGKRIANRVVSSGANSYYAEDFIGSSRVITTSAGATCYDADFYPYGAESNVTNTCPQNYKWTGKERDAETGNDDFDARYYSPVYGRFLSADWSAVPAPVPYANLTNPQTLNLYAIVRDNPESYADLDGHCYPWCTVLGGAAVGALIGGGSEIIAAKMHGKSIDWNAVKGSIAKGAIAGAAIGLAGPGAGIGTTAALGAAGNAVGGIADRTIRGGSTSEVISPTKVATDLVVGAAGGALGSKAEEAGKFVAEGSSKIAASIGDQEAAAIYSNNKAAIGTGFSKAADIALSTAESYHEQDKQQQQPQKQQQTPKQVCQQGQACT